MRYPWIFVLLLAVIAVAVVVMLWRRPSAGKERPAWVANAGQLLQLPAFFQARRRARLTMATAGAALVIAVVAMSFVAGAPVDRRVENPVLARRDLVLCLDASGSMLPYDGAILTQMSDMVSQFSGERVSLQMWSAQSVVKFPLTDDYDLVRDVLNEASGIIDRGYMGQQGDYVLVTPELSDYLQGIDAPGDDPIASLVGDGLASCVLGFDHRDQERSRTIILATDNEVMGPEIYTLAQAVDFASQQNVNIIALYPAAEGMVWSEGEDLQRAVEAAGGSFYQADDPAAIDGIIADIQSQQLADTAGQSTVVETDRPRTALLWAVWMAVIALAVLSWRRI